MAHNFTDKLFVFIGNPERCSRQAARDALAAVGGVVTDRLTVFMHYAVAFPGAETTKVYEKAFERDKYGQIVLLNEKQFFDVLEGNAEPPEKKKPPRSGVIITEAKDPDAFERSFEKVRKDFIDQKRVISVARHGLPTPDGGRMKADLRSVHSIIRLERFRSEQNEQFRSKIAVTLETLKSKPIHENAIVKGLAAFNTNAVIEFEARAETEYWVRVSDEINSRVVNLKYTCDGTDLESYSCSCSVNSRSRCICKHIVAAILGVQGGIVETKVTLGKTATVTETVDKTNTAKAVGSGSLDVFATPMMIALMERAAYKVLADALDEGQTSVGTSISVNHTAASPVGAKISATATITSVSGRKIVFELSANDENRSIGEGKHIRMIVDRKRFMERARK
jgi:predicted thioesterase